MSDEPAAADDFLHPEVSTETSALAFDDFDLGAVASARTADLDIVHPVKRIATGWIWTIAGPGHPATLALSEKFGEKDRDTTFEREKAILTNRQVKKLKTVEVVEDNAERLAGRVLGWNHGVKFTDPSTGTSRTIEFSPRATLELLKNPDYAWLFAQVSIFVREDESFLRGSRAT